MKKVKVKDAKPGMVVIGHERRDFPETPATIVSLEKSRDPDYRGWYRITFAHGKGSEVQDYPANVHLKIRG